MKIFDANPKDPFDFSIDHYNQQLVAGYSRSTPRYGLVAYVPDYYKVRKISPTELSGRTTSKPLFESGGASRANSKPLGESRGSIASHQKPTTEEIPPQEHKPKKKSVFARLLHLGR